MALMEPQKQTASPDLSRALANLEEAKGRARAELGNRVGTSNVPEVHQSDQVKALRVESRPSESLGDAATWQKLYEEFVGYLETKS